MLTNYTSMPKTYKWGQLQDGQYTQALRIAEK